MDFSIIALLLLTSFFIGFGIVIPVLCFVKTKQLQKIAFKNVFILTAVQAVRVAGFLYFVFFLLDTYLLYYDYAEFRPWEPSYKEIILGDDWIVYWFPATMYLSLTQMLWIRQFYTAKLLLLILCILILILPSYWFVKLLVDDISNLKFSSGESFTLISLILSCVIFIFTTITIILVTGKLKTLKQ